VLKFLKRVHKAELQNIRTLWADAEPVLSARFAAESVDHLWLNHPDPWPKQRHRRKRFVRREKMEIVWRLLRPGGGFSLRTDARAYADEALELLERMDGFENVGGRPHDFALAPLVPFETQFESRCKQHGLPIFYLEYRKRGP